MRRLEIECFWRPVRSRPVGLPRAKTNGIRVQPESPLRQVACAHVAPIAAALVPRKYGQSEARAKELIHEGNDGDLHTAFEPYRKLGEPYPQNATVLAAAHVPPVAPSGEGSRRASRFAGPPELRQSTSSST